MTKEKKERLFITAKLDLINRGNRIEFEIDLNITQDELNYAVSLWVPNSPEHTAESLCDFIMKLDPDYRAYTMEDRKYLNMLNNTDPSKIPSC